MDLINKIQLIISYFPRIFSNRKQHKLTTLEEIRILAHLEKKISFYSLVLIDFLRKQFISEFEFKC